MNVLLVGGVIGLFLWFERRRRTAAQRRRRAERG